MLFFASFSLSPWKRKASEREEDGKRGEGKGGQAEARKNSGRGTVEVEVDEGNRVEARATAKASDGREAVRNIKRTAWSRYNIYDEAAERTEEWRERERERE